MVRKKFSELASQQKRKLLATINCNIQAESSRRNAEDTELEENGNENQNLLAIIRNENENNQLHERNENSSNDHYDEYIEGIDNADNNINSDNDNDNDNDDENDDENINRNTDEVMENDQLDVERNFPESRKERCKVALGQLFLKINLKHNHANELLQKKDPFNLSFLPNDCRSLRKTPTVTASTLIQDIDGGQYLHIGFEQTMARKLSKLDEKDLPPKITIDFSTDGAKLNNGITQFWPIQCRALNIADKNPVIVGVFKGDQKPKDAFQFFHKFVCEIMEIQEKGGLLIKNHLIRVEIRCFIADAPARAFALNHQGHMSSYACSKCKVKGHRCSKQRFRGTMVFTKIQNTLRTDDEYRAIADKNHQKGESPLAPLIGLVSKVPFEGRHLIYLGNVKKVLCAHIKGQFGCKKLNKRMNTLKSHCPSEFNRKPNPLTMLSNFKATEYRQFILYTAPAILYGILSTKFYEHFLLLHCVTRFLNFKHLDRNKLLYCQAALETYVTMCHELYGEQFLSYNVHSLLHVVADVEKFGSLDSFSAFAYENNMPEFRKYIRKPHLPLQQYYKRICERNNIDDERTYNETTFVLSKNHSTGPCPSEFERMNIKQFKNLKTGANILSTSDNNNCFILHNSDICIIQNIIKHEDDIYLVVKKFLSTGSFYDMGCTSDLVGVYYCKNLSDQLQTIHFNDIKNKCYRMPKWSNIAGETQNTVENEFICTVLLSHLGLQTF